MAGIAIMSLLNTNGLLATAIACAAFCIPISIMSVKIRVMETEAALKDALAGATVIGATLQTTQTTASVYDASISEIEIRLAKLEKDRQRYENLVKRNAATPIRTT